MNQQPNNGGPANQQQPVQPQQQTALPPLPVLPAFRAGHMANGIYVPPIGGYSCHIQPSRIQGLVTKFPRYQGLAPPGISQDMWNKAINCVDSQLYKARGGASGGLTGGSSAARPTGELRALTIERLIEKGHLPANFQDLNP